MKRKEMITGPAAFENFKNLMRILLNAPTGKEQKAPAAAPRKRKTGKPPN